MAAETRPTVAVALGEALVGCAFYASVFQLLVKKCKTLLKNYDLKMSKGDLLDCCNKMTSTIFALLTCTVGTLGKSKPAILI